MPISGFLAFIIGCILSSIVSAITKLSVENKDTQTQNTGTNIAGIINCIICLITFYFMIRSTPETINYGSPMNR